MKAKKKAELTLLPSKSLMNLGLTKQEALTYQLLINEGALSAASVSKKLDIMRNASYRLLKKLEDYGLITILETSPTTFQARPPKVAIEYFLQNKTKDLETYAAQSIVSLVNKDKAPETRIDIISSKSEMFSLYASFAKEAKNQILIISIGEDVSDETKLANRDALARKVIIRFIPQLHDKSNKNILEAWKKMGLQIRYFKDSGYHLVIFDQNRAILMASNPQKPSERNGVVIYSNSIVKALINHFEIIWEKGIPF